MCDPTRTMEAPHTNAVALKLPAFWVDHPRVWLQQAEAQFALKNITADVTKYYYVVAALDQATALRVVDILEDPPEHGKYDNLRRRLTDVFGLSPRQRADRLLEYGAHSLGDMRPSQLMDEMLGLLGGHKPCLLFESIFLKSMPEDVRMQLTMASFDDPRALAKTADALWQARRQQRHLAYISEFTTDVRHIEGKHNTVADTLSRDGISAITAPLPGVDYDAKAAAQLIDDGIANMWAASTGLVIRDIPLNTNGLSICCDVSTDRPRPLVPDTWQRIVFDAVHGLSRPSIRTTRKMIAEKFVWRGLNKQVGAWAKSCLRCQAAKVHRHTASPVTHFAPTTRRFDHVHVDLVGLLPPSQNHRYLFTVVDRFTRWAEAIPLVDADRPPHVREHLQLTGWLVSVCHRT